jgi:hypothetical protein
LAGERPRYRAFELRLFEAPIFKREEVALGQRLVAADRFGIGDDADRVLGKVGGNARVLRRAAEAEQADARHEHDARRRVELGLCRSRSRVLTVEIAVVFAGELGHSLAHGVGKRFQVACLGVRHDQRLVLGADDVVRRHHAALAVGRKLRAVHVTQDLGRGAEIRNEANGLALALDGDRAADDGGNLRRRSARRGERARRENDGPALAQAALGQRHHLDHALIGLARTLAEGEDAVLVQDEARDIGLRLEHFGRGLGQAEARRDIGHDAHAPVIHFARERLAVTLIDKREHGSRVGVIDEFVRQEGVQQRLNRRIGRRGIEQVQPLHVDHGLVGERSQRAEPPQRLELHRRQAPGLDICHVGAGALDGDDVVHLAKIVARLRLDRGVAAAMQNEQRIAAEEARGVNAERDVAGDALCGVGLDHLLRRTIIPLAFHGARCCKFRTPGQGFLEEALASGAQDR